MKTKNTNISENKKEIKYPFSGIAPNLIVKFLILGYDQKTIEFTYMNCNIDSNENFGVRYNFFEFEERPEIVNEICNDYSKDLLDNDLILELIFPNYPQMLFLNKEIMQEKIRKEKERKEREKERKEKEKDKKDKKDQKEPKDQIEIEEDNLITPYSVIFSINPQDNSGSKKSYNGLGYVFYVIQEHKFEGEIDGYLYIPTAYVILSEFPYFYQFNEICKHIYFQMKKEDDEIPIDIIIYNTVKFAPSPINKSINLLFGNQIGVKQNNNNNNIEKLLSNLNLKSNSDRITFPSIFFTQLSGYPLIDINMSFIFNLIPPEIIIEVFIFTFLEHDIIFYSSRPDFLNCIMYIFTCFNYPFNDSIYYWHILSVSQESFMSGTSTFVGKTSSTMTGILSIYNPEILTTKKIKEHFVLDIDNKNFFFLYQEENDDVKETMALYTYIKQCSEHILNFMSDPKKEEKKSNFPDGIHLYESIKDLMEELMRRSKKVTSVDYNNNNQLDKPNFFKIYHDENEMLCIELNKRLQKAFYIFIMQIMKNIIKFKNSEAKDNKNESKMNMSVETSSSQEPKAEQNNGIIEEEKKLKLEEEKKLKQLAKKAGKIFRGKFMDSSKYNSFVINFCDFHETIDLYRIPYNFINEFIYYSNFYFSKDLKEIFLFKIIDQFYGKLKLIDFEEESEKMQKEIEKDNTKKKETKKNLFNNSNNKSKKELNKENKNKINKKELSKTYEEEIRKMNFKKDDKDLQNIYLFSFDNFSEFYQEKLRFIINREQEDDKENFFKIKSNNRLYKKYKRNNFFLSQKILNTYITFINNNLKEILKAFELIKCEYKEEINDELNSSTNINNNKSSKKDNKLDPKEEKPSVDSKEVKDEKIDYFYLLQNKPKMDKALKEKYFGIYDDIMTSDVIEHYFITEKCFSSYTLIKFSLLNILAVTRIIDSKIINNLNIIQIICDFCDITKLEVKKYMNIYLNIFREIYKKKDEELMKKFEIVECIKKIFIYFQKKKMILTEENDKFLNDFKNKMNSEDISPLTESELFIKFVKENGTFFKITKSFFSSNIKEYENCLKNIESIHLGKYQDDFFKFNYKELTGLYEEGKSNNNISNKDKSNNDKQKYIPKTPILLYDSTSKILKKYLTNISNENIPFNELYNDIISLLFYFKIPIIEGKWIENIEEKKIIKKTKTKKKDEKDKNKKKDEKKNNKSGKKKNNEVSDSIKIDESDSNQDIWEEFETEVPALNAMLIKIIAILVDLINIIKDKKFNIQK